MWLIAEVWSLRWSLYGRYYKATGITNLASPWRVWDAGDRRESKCVMGRCATGVIGDLGGNNSLWHVWMIQTLIISCTAPMSMHICLCMHFRGLHMWNSVNLFLCNPDSVIVYLVKCLLCGVSVRNFVWNFIGLHIKFGIHTLLNMHFTDLCVCVIYDVISLSESVPWSQVKQINSYVLPHQLTSL